jgi:hypothetical protein
MAFFGTPGYPSSSWDRPSERFDSSSNLPGFKWWEPQNTGENRFMSREHPGYRGPLADISEQGNRNIPNILDFIGIFGGAGSPGSGGLPPGPTPGPPQDTTSQGGVPTGGPSDWETVLGDIITERTTPGVGGGDESSWWRNLLGFLGENKWDIPRIGVDIFGSAMQSRAMSQYNDELRRRTELMDRLGGEERQRRDYYAQTLMPNLLRGTGFTPEQSRRRIGEFPTSQV